MKQTVLRILMFVCATCVLNSCTAGNQPVISPYVHQGVIDLRTQDLFKQQVALNGEWRFFWQQTCIADRFNKFIFNLCALSIPVAKDSLDGASLPSQGFATYGLTVLLPHQRPDLALILPDLYSASALYLNGKLIAKSGVPGKTAAEAIPFWSTQIVSLPGGSDTLYLLLQVCNFCMPKEELTKKCDRQSVKTFSASATGYSFRSDFNGLSVHGGIVFSRAVPVWKA